MKAIKHFARVAIVTTGLLYVAPVFASVLDNPSCGDEGHDDDKKKDEKKGDDKA